MKNILACLVFVAVLVTAFAIPLRWTDNANNEDGFRVQRKIAGAPEFITVATLPKDTVAYDDTLVLAGIEYTYRVGAYNATGISYSNEATGTFNAPGNFPLAPGGLTIPRPGQVVQISARSEIVRLDQPLIGGFAIVGDLPAKVLIRGIGPGLAPHGVSEFLIDPQLQLFADGAAGVTNDNWSGDEVVTAAIQAQAFPLTTGSADAAMLLELPPGTYTVHLSGVGQGVGVALLEIYEVR